MLNQSNKSHALATLAGLGAFMALAVGEAKEPSHTISGIETRVQGNGREVHIATSKKPTVSVFRLTDPFRILVDVTDATVLPGLDLIRVDDGIISNVSARALQGDGASIVRVEIALDRQREYRVSPDATGIVVSIEGDAAKSAESAKADNAAPTRVELGRLTAKRERNAVLLTATLQKGKPAPEQVGIQSLENPNRIVIDVAGAVASPKWQTVKVGKQGIEKARLAVSPEGVRIVLDLAEGAALPEVTVDADGKALVLRATPAAKPAAPTPPVLAQETTERAVITETPEVPVVTSKPVAATPLIETAKVTPSTGTAQSAQVSEARFEPKDGFYRLTLVLDGEAELVKDEGGSRRMPVLRLKNTKLPVDLTRTLDTTELTGEVLSSVSTYNDGADTIIAARVGALTEHRHWRKGNRVMWDFRGKGGQESEATAELVRYPEESTAGFSSANQAATAAGKVAAEQRRARYTGRRISLDLKDAEIHNVLRLLADVSKLNIVASDDVKGKITLKLRNVPWDQALDIILTSKQLDKVRNGNIIRVAPLEVLEKEEQLRLARKEAMEKLEQLSVRLIAVSYASAKDALKQVQGLLSARGRASIDARTNVIIVEDIEEVLFKVERLVRTLDTQTPQVLIEGRIVEAATSFTRDLGIQWGGQVAFSPAYGNSTGLEFPNTFRVQGGSDDGQTQVGGVLPGNNGFAVNLPAAAGRGAGGTLGFIFGSANNAHLLNLRLSAAETEGRTKIVSSPKVVTLDNRTAKIVSGERVPITVITANGPTTRFINAFLELEVTPHVTSDGGIMMTIKATKNELSQRTDVLGTPGIIAREAETEMLVQDGDTAVLGGVYRRNATESEAMVPFLGRIPVLGWLFKTRRRADSREELLIFISPRIVNRAEALVRGG